MGKEALIAQTSVSEMKVGFILVTKNVPLLIIPPPPSSLRENLCWNLHNLKI